MELSIVAKSTNTFSSRYLAGILTYCREHPELRPRIVRLANRADVQSSLKELGGDCVLLDHSFRALLDSGWRPPLMGIVQSFVLKDELSFPQIGFNNEALGREVAVRLAKEGLRQVLFVGNRVTESSPIRWKGFNEEGQKRGLTVHFFGDGDSQRGFETIIHGVQMADLTETLRKIPKPLGVFGNDDNRGERVLEAAEMAGLAVPRDVAVCCVSSTPVLCEWTRPALSALQLDHEAQGRMAAEWAHRKFLGDATQSDKLIAPWRFVERESSSHLRKSDPLVADALHYMSEHLSKSPSVEDVALATHTSKRTLERRFRSVLNIGPYQAFRDLRMRATLDVLAHSNMELKTIVSNSGWADASQMSRAVKEATGLTPARYRLEFNSGKPLY